MKQSLPTNASAWIEWAKSLDHVPGMDGTGVPMRPAEVADRVGKQPDGSAKTREAKVVTVWTAESRDEAGKPVRDPGPIIPPPSRAPPF